MKNLYVYAYPVQMITFQLVEDNKILTNENCTFTDIIRTTANYLSKESIERIYVVGDTTFADKIRTMIIDNFKIEVERIRND